MLQCKGEWRPARREAKLPTKSCERFACCIAWGAPLPHLEATSRPKPGPPARCYSAERTAASTKKDQAKILRSRSPCEKTRWRLHTPPAGGKRRRATKGQCPNTVRGRDPLCARSWEPDFGACLPKHQSRTPDRLQRRRKFVFLVFVSACQEGEREFQRGGEAKGGRNARRI